MATNSEIATAVAGDGWLGWYLEYAKSRTRAPAMYHIATGLTCLAVACGSKVSWMDYGDKETWPNLYCICIGQTGAGKTTATNIGTDLLRSSIPHSVISDDFTPEALVRKLVQHPASLIYAEEFGTLLAASKKEYNGGMRESLTALYDPRASFSRDRSGKDGVITETVIRPALSMLAGSTIDWLIHHLGEVDFNSGFMPRMLLFPQGDADMEREPDLDAFGRRDDALYNALRKPLIQLATAKMMPAAFEDDAVKYRRRWQDAQAGSTIIAANENMRGMVARISATVFKIAALLTVSDYGCQQRYVVTLPTVKRSASLVAWLVRNSVDLFDKHLVFERFEKDVQGLLDWVTDDGVSRAELLRYSRKPVQEFDRMLTTLEQRGDVERSNRYVEGSTRTTQYIERVYKPIPREPAMIGLEIEPEIPVEIQVEMEDVS